MIDDWVLIGSKNVRVINALEDHPRKRQVADGCLWLAGHELYLYGRTSRPSESCGRRVRTPKYILPRKKKERSWGR